MSWLRNRSYQIGTRNSDNYSLGKNVEDGGSQWNFEKVAPEGTCSPNPHCGRLFLLSQFFLLLLRTTKNCFNTLCIATCIAWSLNCMYFTTTIWGSWQWLHWGDCDWGDCDSYSWRLYVSTNLQYVMAVLPHIQGYFVLTDTICSALRTPDCICLVIRKEGKEPHTALLVSLIS